MQHINSAQWQMGTACRQWSPDSMRKLLSRRHAVDYMPARATVGICLLQTIWAGEGVEEAGQADNSIRAAAAPEAKIGKVGLGPAGHNSQLVVWGGRREVAGWTGGRAGEGPDDDDLESDTKRSPQGLAGLSVFVSSGDAGCMACAWLQQQHQ